MAITFPNSPSSGDTHTTSNGLQYTYDGEKWTTIGTNSAGTWTRTGTTVSLTTATDDLNVDSGTLFVDASTNNVGVGTTSPSSLLHTSAGLDNELQIQSTGSGGSGNTRLRLKSATSTTTYDYYLQGDASGDFRLYDSKNATDRLRIDSSGNVGIGTSSPGAQLHVNSGTSNTCATFESTDSGAVINITDNNARSSIEQNGSSLKIISDTDAVGASSDIRLQVDGSTKMLIDSSGNVGIGTTSPSSLLHVSDGSQSLEINPNSSFVDIKSTNKPLRISTTDASDLRIATNNSDRISVLSTGNVGIGTSTPTTISAGNTNLTLGPGSSGAQGSEIHMESNAHNGANNGANISYINDTLYLVNRELGPLTFYTAATERLRIDSSGVVKLTQSGSNPRYGSFEASSDAFKLKAFSGNASHNATMQFFTGANSPTERMRIDSGGAVFIGKSSDVFNNAGIRFPGYGGGEFTRTSGALLALNRLASDGQLVDFYRQGTSQGSISVSGTTVSYNGAHLARWSQLPGGVERTEILRGSVLSNLDEMCEWGEEDNEQLNRMKVSDVEGDKNVSGVFQAWDDDDDTYTNDFYCAMTGDFVIRIAQGTTVARGDLLMSAGDGTAKPQDDDIVRSKTIAKVTSTTVSETYADNSYCVPCVLMAC